MAHKGSNRSRLKAILSNKDINNKVINNTKPNTQAILNNREIHNIKVRDHHLFPSLTSNNHRSLENRPLSSFLPCSSKCINNLQIHRYSALINP